MEIKTSITSFTFIFILLVAPYVSKGRPELHSEDIYEIDYKGPETHTYIPPPTRSDEKPTHDHGVTRLPISKGLRGGRFERNGKK